MPHLIYEYSLILSLVSDWSMGIVRIMYYQLLFGFTSPNDRPWYLIGCRTRLFGTNYHSLSEEPTNER